MGREISAVRSTMTKVFLPQLGLLRAFGLFRWDPADACWSGQMASRVRTACAVALGICLITGSWLAFTFIFVQTTCRLGTSNTSKIYPTSNPIIQIAISISLSCVTLRGAAVVSCTTFKRKEWDKVAKAGDDLIRVVFGPSGFRTRPYRVAVSFLCLGFLLLTALWSFSQVYLLLHRDAMNFWTEETLYPLELKVVVWKIFLLWSLFSLVPFILAQVLFAVLIILAKIEEKCLFVANQKVKNILCDLEMVYHSCDPKDAESESRMQLKHPSWEELMSDLHVVKEIYYHSAELCDVVSTSYGFPLFFIITLDLVTALGTLATLIAGFSHTEHQLSHTHTRICLGFNLSLMLSYITFFISPMANFHSQDSQPERRPGRDDSEIERFKKVLTKCQACTRTGNSPVTHAKTFLDASYKLRQLMNLLERRVKVDHNVKEQIDELCIYSEKRVPCYTAGSVFHISWGFIIKILTCVASFAVLAHEIVEISAVKDSLAEILNATTRRELASVMPRRLH